MSRLHSLTITGILLLSAMGTTACAARLDAGRAIATFQVGPETFRVELATPELVAHAQQLLDGEDVPAIPLGAVVRDDPGVNEPWSWHLDPDTVEFAFVTIEVCDGLPSYVEDGTVTSDTFCPWSAQLIELEGTH